MYFVVFALSLVFLLLSANYLVRMTEKLSSSVKISPLVIGATAIALGTSLPELSVTLTSILNGASDVSLGNIIGSNVTNILLVTGLCILLFPIRVGTTKTQKNNLFNLLITITFIIAFFLPSTYKTVAIATLGISYLLFFVAEIFWGEKDGKKIDKKIITKLQKSNEKPLITAIKIVSSIAILLVSSNYTVLSSLKIAEFFKLQGEIVALSLVALGTSLPELITSITSGIDKDWKLLIGDIQGSSIFNIGVLGAITLYFSKSLSLEVNLLPLLYLLASTIFVCFLTKKYEGDTIPRYYGLIFLGLYSSYLLVIFL